MCDCDSCLCEGIEAAELHRTACSIVYLRKQKTPLSLYCWIVTFGRLLSARGWLSEASLQQNGAVLRRSVLFPNFFSGISSHRLTPTHSSYSLHGPPSSSLCLKCLPNSLAHENNCSCMFEETQPSPQTGFSTSHPTPHRSSAHGQADRLPPPPPPPLLLLFGKVVMFSKIGSEVHLSLKPQKWLRIINIFDMQVERGAISPASECLKHAETDSVRAKAIKILPCAGLFLTRALWQDYKILEISTHLGIRTALPDDVKKMLYILPVSGSSILASFFSVRQGQEHVWTVSPVWAVICVSSVKMFSWRDCSTAFIKSLLLNVSVSSSVC